MGSSQSAIAKAIKATLGNDSDLYAFPGDPLFKIRDAKPYNLDIQVKPAAVTYPKTKEQVAAIVRAAVQNGCKVQARCGGHSYANYCIGGADGAVVIDMKHFQQFSMDRKTWRATIGGGTLLGDVTKRLHDAGNRAISHGTCPQVGIGGHATIGGLGPTSRQWGSALDHVVEVEIVLADASIKRCSETQNADIFWAVKGAGASFGVITEFVVRTEAEPGEAVEFSFSFHFGKYASMAPIFKAWQTFVSDPNLTRKFTSGLVFTQMGMVISGTFFGTEKEYDKLNMDSRFPGKQDKKTIVFKDWLGLVGHWAEDFALQIGGGLPAPLYTKSLAFNGCNLIPDEAIDKILTYMDKAKKGTLIWFVIFDLEGGAINDVPQDATAYAHRDALFYMQSYAVGVPKVSNTTKKFLRGLSEVVKDGMPGGGNFGAYAGYVDPELPNGQQAYWRTNLPRLEAIKGVVDPKDVFWNPQSVRPVVGGSSAARARQANGDGNANTAGGMDGAAADANRKMVEGLEMDKGVRRPKPSFLAKMKGCFK
ncbi:hypothetical protein IFR04_011196 [Cadophora malorum]|uniref:FAD-binding PCMH-type domain-containing protein n=1 Tax=Cadophora malorum TaxID=108018 RepID=A0A8H7W2U0_9HELO|nr:hypothetical protein IFR04_011196 [Cadophora malorum]